MKRRFKFFGFNRLFLIYLFNIFLLVAVLYGVYYNHRNTIVKKQREQLVTSAEAAAMYLEDFFEANVRLVDGYFDLGVYIEDFDSAIADRVGAFTLGKENYVRYAKYLGAYELNNEKIKEKLGLPYEQSEKIRDFFYEGTGAVSGSVFRDEYGGYDLVIVKRAVYEGESRGIIAVTMDLEAVYDMTIGKIDVGNRGYFTVKDKRGTIIMHRDRNQLGINSFQERRDKYPDIDENELKSLINNQLRGEKGSSIVETYWWGEDEKTKVKKIIGYYPSYIGDTMWVVSAIVSYNEIAGPVNRTAVILIVLGVAILATSCAFILKYTRTIEAGKRYKMKAEYEGRLNDAMRRLIKHEENLNRLNRIETLGMFSSAMMHDIRNYLVPIRIYCDILLSKYGGDSETSEIINDVIRAVDNCTDLTRKILGYGSGKGREPEREVFDGRLAVEECLSLAKAMLPENIILESVIGQEPVMLYGNKLELKQIVLNLMTNSYQAMEEKGGRLTVKFFLENGEGCLIISDTGCGISEEMKKDIFTPFYTSKDDSKGTGLGLPIVKRLVFDFNGTIDFCSREGVGTVFTIKFPAESNS